MSRPYDLPSDLPPDLARVLAYWRGLLRGNAEMPFWDDARLTDLPDLNERLFLIDVFDRPQRFRFASVGEGLAAGLAGLFLDETSPAPPLDFLLSQSSATVECAAPTFLRRAGDGGRGYSRLLLPMWGDGRTGMLLGAIEFG